MRKLLSLYLSVVLLCLPLGALAAEGQALILTGKVEAKDTVTVYAPFGGTVKDFSLAAGDRLYAGDTLLELDTIKIYAPFNGTVRGIFVQPGDTAAQVQQRYGALCYIEPDEALTMQASTSYGYDSEENRRVHVGETVYLRSINNTSREGTGRVIAVSGENFVVEVSSGNLETKDTLNIFRDRGYYTESRIGRGISARTEPVAVSGDGAVLSVAVREGTRVQRGDLLFELVSGSFDGMTATGSTITMPQDGIIAALNVNAGQAVNKNQPVAVLYTLDELELVSSISEVDLPRLQVGDSVSLTFDAIADKNYAGTVSSISEIGTPSEDYTNYAVRIAFVPDGDVRMGMSGTGSVNP